jgi:tetratricopeptide (TPR) repeat protein
MRCIARVSVQASVRLPALFAMVALLAACSLTAPPRPAPPQPRTPPPSQPQLPGEPDTPPAIPAPLPREQPPSQPARPVPTAPVVRQYQLGPASRALVEQARALAASGDFPVAVATIERALRIEPANPLLWIELGQVHQAAGNYAQAESTARKALSLASADLAVQSAAWQLAARSLRARGKVQEAQRADAQAYALLPDR